MRVRQYVKDIVKTGRSDVKVWCNRKCPVCAKQMIPANVQYGKNFTIPITPTYQQLIACIPCSNIPFRGTGRIVIEFGRLCNTCSRSMRASNQKPDPEFKTVQHGGKGKCNTCWRRETRLVNGQTYAKPRLDQEPDCQRCHRSFNVVTRHARNLCKSCYNYECRKKRQNALSR